MLCREKGWDCVSLPTLGSAKRTQGDTLDARPSKRTSRRKHSTSTGDRTSGTRGGSLTEDQASPESGSASRVLETGDLNERVYTDSQVQASSPNDSSMIVGPVVAEDIRILEPYLTNENPRHHGGPPGRLSTTSKAPGNPILYLSVPRRRDGLKLAKDPGASQREIMVQILHPFCEELVNLYERHF